MRRALRRWFAGACACTGAFLLVCVVLTLLQGAGAFMSALPMLVLGAILAAFWPRWRRLVKYNRETFDWYQASNPDRVQRGKVRCCKCDSDQIGTQTLRQHTYTRAHFCRTCGTNLYYSPET